MANITAKNNYVKESHDIIATAKLLFARFLANRVMSLV